MCSSWMMGKTERGGLTSVLTKRSVRDTLIIERLPATSTLVHQHDVYVVSFLTLITHIVNWLVGNVTVLN
jgi:hypothetical protein